MGWRTKNAIVVILASLIGQCVYRDMTKVVENEAPTAELTAESDRAADSVRLRMYGRDDRGKHIGIQSIFLTEGTDTLVNVTDYEDDRYHNINYGDQHVDVFNSPGVHAYVLTLFDEDGASASDTLHIEFGRELKDYSPEKVNVQSKEGPKVKDKLYLILSAEDHGLNAHISKVELFEDGEIIWDASRSYNSPTFRKSVMVEHPEPCKKEYQIRVYDKGDNIVYSKPIEIEFEGKK